MLSNKEKPVDILGTLVLITLVPWSVGTSFVVNTADGTTLAADTVETEDLQAAFDAAVQATVEAMRRA